MSTKNDLAEAMPNGGYPAHPIADVFPMMEGDDLKQIADSIADIGQQEDVVLHEGKVVDGRNRQKAALMRSVTPRFRLFGSRDSDGESLVAFVKAHNIDRRHLNPSQRAAAAADMLPFYEDEAKSRQQAAGGADTDGAAAAPESTVDTSGEFAQAPPRQTKKKGHGKGKAAAKAAADFSVSTRSVEAATKLKREDPKAHAKVKAGTKSLNAATTGVPSKGTAAAAEYDKALARIEAVCGKPQADAVKQGAILRNRKEVLAYAALTDKQMLAVRALIDQGWTVKKATHWKAEDILPTHTVRAIMERAIAEGGAYEQKVHDENQGVVAMIKVTMLKGEATAARKAKTKKASGKNGATGRTGKAKRR